LQNLFYMVILMIWSCCLCHLTFSWIAEHFKMIKLTASSCQNFLQGWLLLLHGIFCCRLLPWLRSLRSSTILRLFRRPCQHISVLCGCAAETSWFTWSWSFVSVHQVWSYKSLFTMYVLLYKPCHNLRGI